MNGDVVLKLEGVSKKFCRTMRRSMYYGAVDVAKNMFGIPYDSGQLRKNEFWALDEVSFELKRGEALGVIGLNGSGKTTILRLISGIFPPDKGRITINGRVGSLISVGAGFHPDLTGRENIYLNGTILGMTKKEINEKFDAIVDFAEIGDFLDAPVSAYSSGMHVRLGFAIAIHCNPDILLVDEILAVGDKEFQIKCYQKIHEVKRTGTSIVLVSHNEYTIREQAKFCLYLDNGKIKFVGTSEETINLYIRDMLEHRINNRVHDKIDTPKIPKKAEITSLDFFDKDWKRTTYLESGQELNVILECIFNKKVNDPIFGINFYDNSGFMYCADSYYEDVKIDTISSGRVRIKINIPRFHLPTNKYCCSALISEENVANLIDWHDRTYDFTVGRAKNARGSIKLLTTWKIETE